MSASIRTTLQGLFALCLATGLLGCSIFSSSANAKPAPMPASTKMDHAHHHQGAADAAPASTGHAHHGDDPASGCDDCNQTLINRVSTTPDKAVSGSTFPLPVLVIPATLVLDGDLPAVTRDDWPPGLDPPLPPVTLTQQKISLLM